MRGIAPAVVHGLAAASAVGVLAGCAASGRPSADPVLLPSVAGRMTLDDAAVWHFLGRVTFGPTAEDVNSVKRIGLERYLERQLHPELLDDGSVERRLAAFETLRLSSGEIAERYFRPAMEARRARQAAVAAAGSAAQTAVAATGSAAQAAVATASPATQGAGQPRPPNDDDVYRRERLVLVELAGQKLLRAIYSERQLQEVLVDFWFNHFNVFAGKGADRTLVTAYERDAIRPRVFGTFRELLGATAESPAMLFYLDNWMSVRPNGPGAAAASPRRPRRGLNENYARELMELHTLGVDGGYTQQDVMEVARCFTGWTIARPAEGGDFRFDPRQHDQGPKTVLGHRIAAGGGKSDGDKVLDILAAHPSTARFIAAELVRRFVSDNPPPSLVDRVAKRFRDTGGNLREVYRTILLSPDFWAGTARSAKLKSPFEFVVSALRATGAEVADASPLVRAVRTLGMPLYACPTPNGYGDTAATWMNAGTLLGRLNLALALADGRLPGVRFDLGALAGSADVAVARPRLVARLLARGASPGTRASTEKAATLPQLAALVLGSPDFQRR